MKHWGHSQPKSDPFTDCNVTSQYWEFFFFCHDSRLFNSRHRLDIKKYKYFVICTKLNFQAPLFEHLFFWQLIICTPYSLTYSKYLYFLLLKFSKQVHYFRLKISEGSYYFLSLQKPTNVSLNGEPILKTKLANLQDAPWCVSEVSLNFPSLEIAMLFIEATSSCKDHIWRSRR